MKLVDISTGTESAFFTCLPPEEPEDLTSTIHSRNWYAEHKDKGYKAQILVLDDGRIVGKCHYIPIEYSSFVGKDFPASQGLSPLLDLLEESHHCRLGY